MMHYYLLLQKKSHLNLSKWKKKIGCKYSTFCKQSQRCTIYSSVFKFSETSFFFIDTTGRNKHSIKIRYSTSEEEKSFYFMVEIMLGTKIKQPYDIFLLFIHSNKILFYLRLHYVLLTLPTEFIDNMNPTKIIIVLN